jgi:GrpB-like predicted nucleotidyltransferase (UPF0157 family)
MNTRMISIVPYRATWSDEFRTIGGALRQSLSGLALRIDHIGSTSVPGLAAKDIIDVQVTAESLGPAVEAALNRVGYRRLEHISQDHVPPGVPHVPDEWRKWIFTPAADQRRANVHVRLSGRANQRYALLFRDYLRTHPAAAQAYVRVKEALSTYHPEDMKAYYDVKDPVCDIIMDGAEAWAVSSSWNVGPSDC